MKSRLGPVFLAVFLVSALSFTGCSDSDSDQPGPAANVQGDWKVTIKYDDQTASSVEWTLTQVGSGLKGTYRTAAVEVRIMGTIFDNQLSLVADTPEMPVFVGTITDNNNIVGSLTVSEGTKPGKWTATRP